jgi:hypothetical protein
LFYIFIIMETPVCFCGGRDGGVRDGDVRF